MRAPAVYRLVTPAMLVCIAGVVLMLGSIRALQRDPSPPLLHPLPAPLSLPITTKIPPLLMQERDLGVAAYGAHRKPSARRQQG